MMQNPPNRTVVPSSSSSSTTSPETLIRELSAQTAPLWRNAPINIVHRHLSPSASASQMVAPSPPKVPLARSKSGQQKPIVSFQQSLRSYPSASASGHRNLQRLHSSASGSSASGTAPITHNYITNLDLEQTSPFFLDYLDTQAAINQQSTGSTGLAGPAGSTSGPNAFDHRKFMNMFQTDPRMEQGECGDGGATGPPIVPLNHHQATESIQSSIDSVTAAQPGGTTSSNNNYSDSLAQSSNKNTSFHLEQQDLKNNNQRQTTKPLISRANSNKTDNLVVLRRPRKPSTMDKQNMWNDVNQRLQNVTERRSQIEDARKERLLRQLDNFSTRIGLGGGPVSGAAISGPSSQYQQQSSSQNPSVAFGSTRPRNIDLTRPLVSPWSNNSRPKSEIYSGSIFGSDSVNVSTYSKDDSNYRAQRPAAGRPATACFTSPLMSTSMHSSLHFNQQPTSQSQPQAQAQPQPQQAQQQHFSIQPQAQFAAARQSSSSDDTPRPVASVGVSASANHSSRSQQTMNSQSNNQPTIRAVRRHDPELVPALQKYNFRDYTGPGSGVSTTTSALGGFGTIGFGHHQNSPGSRTSNSMVNSITSVKSFNNGGAGGGGSNNRYLPLNQQARPKKSYSMNRLDQLAQPRRRPETVSKEQKALNRHSQISTPSPREGSSNTKRFTATTPTSGGNGGLTSSMEKSQSASSQPRKPRVQPKPSTTPTQKQNTTVPNVNEGGSGGGFASGRTRPATSSSSSSSAPKPRPLSHYEPLVDHNNSSSGSGTTSEQQQQQQQQSSSLNGNQDTGGSATAATPADSAVPSTGEEADKLAEYKRALAEKRAQYRKYQQELEQKNKNNVRNGATGGGSGGGGGRGKATIVRVNPLSDNLEQELQQSKKQQSSTMSTSSSSSSSSDDDESQRPVVMRNGTNSNSNNNNSNEDANSALKDKLSLSTMEPHPVVVDSELVNSPEEEEEEAVEEEPNLGLSPNLLMTTSCDASLLAAATSNNSGSNSFGSDSSLGNGSTTPTPARSAASTVLTKQEIEQRNEMLKKHEMERQKRKSRVQEILKRTIGTPEGGSSSTNTSTSATKKSSDLSANKEDSSSSSSSPPSSVDSNLNEETNNNNLNNNNNNIIIENSSSSNNNNNQNNNNNGNDDHQQLQMEPQLQSSADYNDNDDDSNICDKNNSKDSILVGVEQISSFSPLGVASVNSNSAAAAAGASPKEIITLSPHSNGNGNLHLDMKTYCAENDQSLPPTNGF